MIEIDRFFDIETADWTKFAVGGVVTAGTEEYLDTTTELELFYNLISPGKGTVWSWNGGKFDMLWLLDQCRKERHNTPLNLTCKIATAGPRITSLQVNGVTFRDSVAVAPFSLQKAAVIASITMSKDTGVSCTCPCSCVKTLGAKCLVCDCYDLLHVTDELYHLGECDDCYKCPTCSCGGYCGVTPELIGMDPQEKLLFRQYLKEDCLTGLRIMEALITEANRCDYDLTGTIGGSSFKTAKRKLNLQSAKWHSSQYTMARQAYYGGRVEVFQPSAESGFAYDINSAYPAALVRTKLPTGEMLECPRDKAQRAYARGKEGLYLATCFVPEMFVPPLPVRLSTGRVAFPTGEVRGIWPAIELREAQSLGCDVTITGGLVWGDSEIVFKDYMAEVWANRARYKPDGPFPNKGLHQWHKWFANSLTGKLAERPDKERIVMYPGKDEIKWCPGGACKGTCRGIDSVLGCGASKCCDRKHRGSCGAWRMLDTNASLYLAPFYRISECAHVHWAAYLTAAARIQLAQQLRADGQGGLSALYCDTDSVYATATRSKDLGPALGEWGYDGKVADWLAVAPKLYRYESEEGKQVIKAKGLSGINRTDFDNFVAGQTIVSTRGVKSFKSACKDPSGSLFVRKALARSNKSDGLHYGSRVLHSDGKTYPQTMAQLLAWESSKQRTVS